mmetsp:Transcript_29866/g.75245  ORF Transcript_29866/g.75245 Transcript_29866/m.75245 type:complete len:239 (+) Transcript_29866:206-922(+)
MTASQENRSNQYQQADDECSILHASKMIPQFQQHPSMGHVRLLRKSSWQLQLQLLLLLLLLSLLLSADEEAPPTPAASASPLSLLWQASCRINDEVLDSRKLNVTHLRFSSSPTSTTRSSPLWAFGCVDEAAAPKRPSSTAALASSTPQEPGVSLEISPRGICVSTSESTRSIWSLRVIDRLFAGVHSASSAFFRIVSAASTSPRSASTAANAASVGASKGARSKATRRASSAPSRSS